HQGTPVVGDRGTETAATRSAHSGRGANQQRPVSAGAAFHLLREETTRCATPSPHTSIRRVFTRDPTDAPLFRLTIAPSETNGLRTTHRSMVDKITTMSKAKLGTRIGRLPDGEMVRLNRAMTIFLGLADASPERRSVELRPCSRPDAHDGPRVCVLRGQPAVEPAIEQRKHACSLLLGLAQELVVVAGQHHQLVRAGETRGDL